MQQKMLMVATMFMVSGYVDPLAATQKPPARVAFALLRLSNRPVDP